MSRLLKVLLVSVFAVSIGGAGTAFAQDDEDPCAGDACGGDVCGDGGDACGGGDMADDGGGGDMADGGGEGDMMGAMPGPGLLKKGGIGVDVTLDVNLSKDAVAKPFSIAPDVWYGVSDKLTVGVAHSSWANTGFIAAFAPASGLCLAGEENGCAKVYNNVSILGRFGLKNDASMGLTADGGIVIRQLSDPMLLGIKAGVLGHWRSGKIMVMFSPNIYIGATERDFNKEALNVPVMAVFMANPKLGVGVQTGIAGPLDGFGDFFAVPLAVGAHYMLNENMMAGGAIAFPIVAGGTFYSDAEIAGFDFRSLSLFFSWMQ